MTRYCQVPGCEQSAATRFATHCRSHRANLRRHGEADQRAITKSHIKPYLKLTRVRIAKNAHSPAWTTLDARWRALVDHAQRIVAKYESGQPCSRFEKIAAYEIAKIGENVDTRAIVEMTIAMVMMRELDPRCFRSDRAFWLQLSRRVRGLTNMNFGERYVHATGKVKRCYRELTPRAGIILGKWLAETLGIGGLHLARLEREDADRRDAIRRELNDALSNLS